MNFLQKAQELNLYFTSGNGVQPNARISIPTKEWEDFYASLHCHLNWQVLSITTAYEQGVGHARRFELKNPYQEGSPEHVAWNMGREEFADKTNIELSIDQARLKNILRWLVLLHKSSGTAPYFTNGGLKNDSADAWDVLARLELEPEESTTLQRTLKVSSPDTQGKSNV